MSLLPVRKGLVFELEITIKLRNYGIILKCLELKDLRGHGFTMNVLPVSDVLKCWDTRINESKALRGHNYRNCERSS
ncbi:28860_t:CDS:2 [Gigaspora margarita]|uniref:28860_t:CDS:1 n=1 Tax=Gigaspora margarita TaxID=4874 RepID=A0ABN7UY38_GIGMA|nr:28860_t:CDS:2 [Gigaspora margarita]